MGSPAISRRTCGAGAWSQGARNDGENVAKVRGKGKSSGDSVSAEYHPSGRLRWRGLDGSVIDGESMHPKRRSARIWTLFCANTGCSAA